MASYEHPAAASPGGASGSRIPSPKIHQQQQSPATRSERATGSPSPGHSSSSRYNQQSSRTKTRGELLSAADTADSRKDQSSSKVKVNASRVPKASSPVPALKLDSLASNAVAESAADAGCQSPLPLASQLSPSPYGKDQNKPHQGDKLIRSTSQSKSRIPASPGARSGSGSPPGRDSKPAGTRQARPRRMSALTVASMVSPKPASTVAAAAQPSVTPGNPLGAGVRPVIAFGRVVSSPAAVRKQAGTKSPAGPSALSPEPAATKEAGSPLVAAPPRSVSTSKARVPSAPPGPKPQQYYRSASVDKARPSSASVVQGAAASATAAPAGARATVGRGSTADAAISHVRRAAMGTSPNRRPASASGTSPARSRSTLASAEARRQQLAQAKAAAAPPTILSAIPEAAARRPTGPSPAIARPSPPSTLLLKPASPRVGALRAQPVASTPPPAKEQAAPDATLTRPAASKPKLSLNMSAIHKAHEGPGSDGSAPRPPLADAVPGLHGPGSPRGAVPPSPAAQAVPKLNLMPVLQERDNDAATQAQVYKVAPAPEKPNSASKASAPKAKPQEEPVDHFYYYPKLDAKEERKTIELIENLPRTHKTHMKKIYETMVEAKQNCEAIAFRGHRLLDQLNSHMKEQLNKAGEENEVLRVQLDEYQRKYEEQQQQMESLKLVLQGMQGLSQTGGLNHMGPLLSALGLGHIHSASAGDGGGQLGGQGLGGLSAEEQRHAEQELLQNISDLSAEMTSVRDTVNQLSSRLAGVAVRPVGNGAHGVGCGDGWGTVQLPQALANDTAADQGDFGHETTDKVVPPVVLGKVAIPRLALGDLASSKDKDKASREHKFAQQKHLQINEDDRLNTLDVDC